MICGPNIANGKVSHWINLLVEMRALKLMNPVLLISFPVFPPAGHLVVLFVKTIVVWFVDVGLKDDEGLAVAWDRGFLTCSFVLHLVRRLWSV